MCWVVLLIPVLNWAADGFAWTLAGSPLPVSWNNLLPHVPRLVLPRRLGGGLLLAHRAPSARVAPVPCSVLLLDWGYRIGGAAALLINACVSRG